MGNRFPVTWPLRAYTSADASTDASTSASAYTECDSCWLGLHCFGNCLQARRQQGAEHQGRPANRERLVPPGPVRLREPSLHVRRQADAEHNAGLKIEYDSCWLGLHCFESYPCRHVVSKVLNIEAGRQIEYDSLRPDLRGCESYLCTYVVRQAPNTNTRLKIEYD